MLNFKTKNRQNTCYQTKGEKIFFGATHVDMSANSCRTGFTLAEVLITLAVIGVVAAITMPNVIANINARSYAERQVNIAQKVTQAMEQMRAHGLLNQNYATTDDFVDELQKYLKIAKRCDSEHIRECWTSDKIINGYGKEVDISTKAKIGKDLMLDSETNNVGLILADGASIILNYNNKARTYDIGDEVKSESVTINIGNGKVKEYGGYRTTSTDSVAFVMDVNGSRGPNSETLADNKPKDIRSFNGATFAPTCQSIGGVWSKDGEVCYLGTNYNSVDCSASGKNLESYKFCGTYISGYSTDSWAGAKYTCNIIGMELPNWDKIEKIRTTAKANGIPDGDYYYNASYWISNQNPFSRFYGGGGWAPVDKRTKLNVLCTK